MAKQEKTLDIVRKAIVPEGNLCLWCSYVNERTLPLICAMNGETSGYNTKMYCDFFNEPLYESDVVDDRIPCVSRKYYQKCFSCITSSMSEKEKLIIAYASLGVFDYLNKNPNNK